MFSPNPRAAINSYRDVGAETGVVAASPQRLILMLYEGAIAAVAAAQRHLQLNEPAAKGEAISNAIAIIDGGLRASLDLNVGGELARNLHDLYAYMAQRLLYANLHSDSVALNEIAQLLSNLRGAWEAITANPAGADAPSASEQPERAAPPRAAPAERLAAAYGRV